MSTQTKGGFANNLTLQMVTLVVGIAILLFLAWRYLW